MTSSTPTDAAMLERAVKLCGTAAEVARRIGTRDARVSLARAGKVELAAEQRAALVALLADPPKAIAAPRMGRPPAPTNTADGILVDRARAALGCTVTGLAARLDVTPHHLSTVRRGLYQLGAGTRAALRQLLGEPVAAPNEGFMQVCVRVTPGEEEAFRDLADRHGACLREAIDAAVVGWLTEHPRRLPPAQRPADLPPGTGWRLSIGTAALAALDARLRAERGAASPRGRAGAVRQAILRAIEKK